VDSQGDLVSGVSDVATRNSAVALNLLDRRTRLLEATDMVDKVALDPYSFTRAAFLQRRRNAVYDGDPPEEVAPAADTRDGPAN
jgi:phospholipid-binding lipoprotein MlaA